MKYIVDLKIPKGDFPDSFSKEDISEYLKNKIGNTIGDGIVERFHNDFQMPPVSHDTRALSMRMIAIFNVELFYKNVKDLLDDPGISKKEFLGKLQELINNAK